MQDLYHQAGISKAELSRRLDLHRDTASSWGHKIPGYATAYLELLIRHNQMRDIIGEAIR